MSDVNFKDIDGVITDLKSGIGLWEDFMLKSSKFSNSIKGTTLACSDFLDSMHTICNMASKSNCGLRNTSINLTKLVMREKKIESKVNNVSNVLNENFVLELEKFINEWRRSYITIKKDRDHECKRANIEYQKSMTELKKTEKKLRNKTMGKIGLSETASLQLDYATQDVQNKRRYIEDLERCALRRAAIEERQRFKHFLYLLKPVLDCQLSIREELDNLEEIVKELYGIKAENLDVLSEELEQTIQEHNIDSNNTYSIQRNYSTLIRQQHGVPNGSKISLSSTSMSTTSSEWNNNVLINSCSEAAGNVYDNISSHNSEVKGDKDVETHYDLNTNQYELESSKKDESGSDDSSSEDDNDISTDHNSQDGVIDNNNELFPLPEQFVNEERLFDLPNDYPDSLPPPPPPKSDQKYIDKRLDSLYPNQSVPPPVYSNLSELKVNAAKKFGANSLCGISEKDVNDNFKEKTSSLPFIDKTIETPKINFRASEVRSRRILNISPPSIYRNTDEEHVSTFGTFVEPDVTQSSEVPPKVNFSMKPSVLRRPSCATEILLPQTPKSPLNTRRLPAQENRNENKFDIRNRGRSMSVTRETNHGQTAFGRAEENFNTIMEKMASRIPTEFKPPTTEKSDVQKIPSYNSSEFSHLLSSPLMVRSNRSLGDRFGRQTIAIPTSTQSQAYTTKKEPVSGPRNPDIDSHAGEEPDDNEVSTSNDDQCHKPNSRKEEGFKQHLNQLIQAPKIYDKPRTSQTDPVEATPVMASFSGVVSTSASSNPGMRSSTMYSKPKMKSSIPSSKYRF